MNADFEFPSRDHNTRKLKDSASEPLPEQKSIGVHPRSSAVSFSITDDTNGSDEEGSRRNAGKHENSELLSLLASWFPYKKSASSAKSVDAFLLFSTSVPSVVPRF
jgi:hypothetical protein